MGSGMLLGHETRIMNRISSQTLQSAYKNGILSNAKDINTGNYLAEVNRPHLVNSTSTNIPSDLSLGIREVFFYSNQNILLQITGIDTSNAAKVWYCVGVTTNGTFTLGAWSAIEPPVTSAGTASKLGLTKLYTSTGTSTDGTMTRKAITDQFNKYIAITSVDDYLAVFQDTEPEESNMARFWVNTAENSEQIDVPQINDSTNNAVDTWSSNKIKSELDKIGQYMIFRCNLASATLTTTDVYYLAIDDILKVSGDISDHVDITSNGFILLRAGTYLITGKFQITSSSVATSVLVGWMSKTNDTSFGLSPESQNAESYMYIQDGTIQAKVHVNPTVITVTEDTYLRFQIKPLDAGSMVIAPEACRFEVTKLK